MKKTLISLISVLFFTACAIPQSPDANKYRFTSLEKVSSFKYRQINNWQAIDSRSLIININPSRSYLLILDRNVWAIKYTEQIKISSVNSRVRSNIDLVQVLNQVSRPGRIESIYLLPDREAQRRVRAEILSEEPEFEALRLDGVI